MGVGVEGFEARDGFRSEPAPLPELHAGTLEARRAAPEPERARGAPPVRARLARHGRVAELASVAEKDQGLFGLFGPGKSENNS